MNMKNQMLNRKDKIRQLARLNKRRLNIKNALPSLRSVFGKDFDGLKIEDYDANLNLISNYWTFYHRAEKGDIVSSCKQWEETYFEESVLFLKAILNKNKDITVKVILTSEEIGIITSKIADFFSDYEILLNLDNHQISIFEPISNSGLSFSRHTYYWAEKKITYKWHYVGWGIFS